MRGVIFVTLFVFGVTPAAWSARSGEIAVVVQGLKNNTGQVVLALHDNADSFPTKPEKAIATQSSFIKNNKAKVFFKNVRSGSYAIAVYHDENKNGKLDSNFIGIPKEGVGTSNDAKGRFGPPKFIDAKFTFEETNKSIIIKIYY